MITRKIVIQKILLEDFINTLIDIYEKGADFVDFVGEAGMMRDNISIVVREEYIRENPEELTKETLNDLLNG